MNNIGTLSEKSLHAGIKKWYALPNDEVEVRLDGFVIDLVRDQQLVEIQTRNFGKMKHKLTRLLENHRVLLLHPIAQEKWIVRQTALGETISRRKSPKKGQVLDLFSELMRIPNLITHPNLAIGVLLTRQEEIWRDDGLGSWRRKKWSLHDHCLLEVVEMITFTTPQDFLNLLPAGLIQPFTNKHLAEHARVRPKLAQRITYTLNRCKLIEQVGKQGRSKCFRISESQN